MNANFLTVGVNGKVKLNDCKAAASKSNQVTFLTDWAQKAGKGTGIVTTTRVTHATPAGAFSHSPNRNFECDSDISSVVKNPSQCRDIASQMVFDEPGKSLKVILGGGSIKFLPKEQLDADGNPGQRSDGLNLLNIWKEQHPQGEFLTNRTQLKNLDFNKTEQIFGLFSTNHMSYNLDADHEKEPSLQEMTEAAIKLLQKEPNGFFLIVEGGRIDHGHHEAWTRKALDETVEFSKAIQAAVDLTNQDDTLMVVTADHAHTMTMQGYPKRGNDILGLVDLIKSQGVF